MVLVSNPLHYKGLITKTKIHVAFWLTQGIMSTEFLFVYIFFQKSATDNMWCTLDNILQTVPSILLYTVNFVLVATVLVVSYVIVTVKLWQRSKSQVSGSNSSDINTKVTKVCWLTVTSFLVFYIPVASALLVSLFTSPTRSYSMAIFNDVTYFIWFYLNNAINPFLYFATLLGFGHRNDNGASSGASR